MKVTAPTLREALVVALARQIDAAVQVEMPLRLAGGASQEVWSVDITVDSGPLTGQHALVLRLDQGGALSSIVLPRRVEFEVLRAVVAADLAAPLPFAYLEALLPGRHALVMERVPGETVGARLVREPGLQAACERLPEQLAGFLARLHNLPREGPLADLWAPAAGQSAAAARLDQLAADLAAVEEPHPALELGLRWLRRQAPAEDGLALVHGDFRVGNLAVTADGLRAVLDWENVHWSDRHADVGWLCLRFWRFGKNDQAVGGLCGRQRFVAAYVAAGGRPLDERRLDYWEILGNVQWAIGALRQARRHFAGQARSVELAALGRVAAEMELEALDLIRDWRWGGGRG